MYRSVTVAAVAGSCFALSGCGTHEQAEAPVGLVIADVTVVSAERAVPMQHAYVRIIDGKITEVSARPLRGKEEIDGRSHRIPKAIFSSASRPCSIWSAAVTA